MQRLIDRLLDEAEEAVRQLNWTVVRERANAVLALDPHNQDALAFLSAADRGLMSASTTPSTQPAPVLPSLGTARPTTPASAQTPAPQTNGATTSAEPEPESGDSSETTRLGDVILAKVTARQAVFNLRRGLSDKARDLLEESLALFRRHGCTEEDAFCLNNLGLVARLHGEYEEGRRLVRDALKIDKESGSRWGVAQSLHNLGMMAFSLGDYAEAKQLYQDSLAIRREIGDLQGIAFSLNNLGNVAVVLKELEESKETFHESMLAFEQLGNRYGIAYCLNNLSVGAYLLGQYSEGYELCEKGVAIYREIGDRSGTALCLISWGDIGLAMGHDQSAKDHYLEALTITSDIGLVPLTMYALAGIARLLVKEGEKEQALELFELILQHPASEQDGRNTAQQGVSDLQTELPSRVFTAARKRGKKANLETAVHLVLQGVGAEHRGS